MLKDVRYPNGNAFTNYSTRVDEELRRSGRDADGNPIGYMASSGFLDKENRKEVSQFDAEQFNKVTARERKRTASTRKQRAHHLHKAGPSVAAQFYEVQGHLPQYDGAADSLSSGVGSSNDRASDQPNSVPSKTKSPISLKVDSTVPSKYVASYPSQNGLGRPALNAVHFAKVNGFFDTIREEEREEIAKYKARFPL